MHRKRVAEGAGKCLPARGRSSARSPLPCWSVGERTVHAGCRCTHLSQLVAQLGGQHVGQGHELGGLVGGVAKHVALRQEVGTRNALCLSLPMAGQQLRQARPAEQPELRAAVPSTEAAVIPAPVLSAAGAGISAAAWSAP